MVQICTLSDEWLSRYEVLKNLHIKLCRRVTGTRTRTTGVIAIALLVLRTGDIKTSDISCKELRMSLPKDYDNCSKLMIFSGLISGLFVPDPAKSFHCRI